MAINGVIKNGYWVNEDTGQVIQDPETVKRLNENLSKKKGGQPQNQSRQQMAQDGGIIDALKYIALGDKLSPQLEVNNVKAPQGSTGIFSFNGEKPQTVEDFMFQQTDPNMVNKIGRALKQKKESIPTEQGIGGVVGRGLETAGGTAKDISSIILNLLRQGAGGIAEAQQYNPMAGSGWVPGASNMWDKLGDFIRGADNKQGQQTGGTSSGRILKIGDKKIRVVGFDSDGTPLIEEV